MNIRTIKNPRRRKRITAFFDDRHGKVIDRYFDIIETYESDDEIINVMEELIEKDPSFYDSYIVLADVLDRNNKSSAGRQVLERGFEKALMKIVDKNGEWPEAMEWGWLENRHIMRIIEEYADCLVRDDKNEDALYLYRKLFRMNPNDNQGVRYKILAIRLGLGQDEWYQPFLVKKGPMAGDALEAAPLMEWFDKNAKKFPEEFEWWFRIVNSEANQQ